MKKLVKIFLPIITLSFLTSCSFGGGEVPEIKTYPVFFDGNGGTLVEGQELQFVHDPSEIVPPVYEKENYTFIGWDVDPSSVATLMKITAIWGEAGEFVVQFYGDGGTWVGGGEEKQIVKDASEIVVPIYEKEGYTFAGWSQDPTTVTSSTIIMALWENESTFRVVFDGNGGTLVSGSTIQVVSSYKEIVEPVFTYPGRSFLGWNPPIDDKIISDTVITALWSNPSTHTIIWQNDNGDELEKDIEVPYGEMPHYDGAIPTKPDPEPGYTYKFSGWTPAIKKVTEDATYTATYTRTANTYTITWKNYNGNVLETDKNVPYGATPSYDGPTPTRLQSDTTVYIWNGGWTPEVKEVTENAVYTATFDEYDITGCTFGPNDSGYTLTKYSGSKTKLVITPIYEGAPVTEIGEEAFTYCTTLQEIVIPDSVLTLGDTVFSGCTSLTKINIPEGITAIPTFAFTSCSSLTEITIPENVKTIGVYAFMSCPSLTTINMLPTTPPAIGSFVFDPQYKNKVTFYVPKGCASAYSAYATYGKVVEAS